MNKKFFAALASATMAFTASGSIAVFADDFVEEKTPVINNGQVAPKPTKVLWNKENFGDLVKEDLNAGTVEVNPAVKFVGATVEVKDGYVTTEALEAVTGITFTSFKGEIKGLEYFTGLTTFTDENATLTNDALDFSANTDLTNIKVNNAKELAEIVLPKTRKTDEGKEEHALTDLEVTGTKLASLNISDYENLKFVNAENNDLSEVTLRKGTADEHVAFEGLRLSNNELETINVEYYDIKNNLKLDGNHFGALDLSKTKAGGAVLGTQKFYVSETLENVNLAETFENFDKAAVKNTGDNFDAKTGVLKLGADATATYTYEVALRGKTADMTVELTKANPMNRLYNPNSGEHFYTADIKEKNALVDLGWNDEGFGWVAAPTKTATKKQAVYRLYNPNAGDHHYTMNADEVKTLVAYGWKSEGTGWYSADDTGKEPTGTHVRVYRQYNPYANGAGSHNYTTDLAENNYLVSLGWTPEGTAWYGLK